ncbi:unnamed protein product [Taenia asiatica]|uniref:Glyco_hydro_3 domain-containing protein n=1 Tax=Taenia asiatica TaxID=60517 RepID=A0A0R3W0C5_TAEAS|nr:unnamed protein product [Taenia asiatica]
MLQFTCGEIVKPSTSSLQAINEGVEVKPNSMSDVAGHESVLDPVKLGRGSSSHKPSIVGDRAVNALAMGESLMQTILGGVSFMDFLDNHYGLQPMYSSCGDVRWGFDCISPVQMMDRLIAEGELYFGHDVEIIPAPGAESKIRDEFRAYRWIVWNQIKVSYFAMLFAFINASSGRSGCQTAVCRVKGVLSGRVMMI